MVVTGRISAIQKNFPICSKFKLVWIKLIGWRQLLSTQTVTTHIEAHLKVDENLDDKSHLNLAVRINKFAASHLLCFTLYEKQLEFKCVNY